MIVYFISEVLRAYIVLGSIYNIKRMYNNLLLFIICKIFHCSGFNSYNTVA